VLIFPDAEPEVCCRRTRACKQSVKLDIIVTTAAIAAAAAAAADCCNRRPCMTRPGRSRTVLPACSHRTLSTRLIQVPLQSDGLKACVLAASHSATRVQPAAA